MAGTKLNIKDFWTYWIILVGIVTIVFSFYNFSKKNIIDRDQMELNMLMVTKQKMILDSLASKLNSLNLITNVKLNSMSRKNTRLIDSVFKHTENQDQLKQFFLQQFNQINDDVQLLKSSGRMDSLAARLQILEDALMQNPGKALALPLLQKELENQKETQSKDIITLKNEISTIYDQNKWFIGLMFTLAIGMISLAVTNFLPKKEKTVKDTSVLR